MTGISRKKAADVLAEVFGTIAGEPDSTCYHTRIIKDQKNRKWKVMRDSSITPVRNDNSNAPMDEYREQKVTIMRNILTHRLGLYGDEFKTCRLHMMNPLKKAAGMAVREAA